MEGSAYPLLFDAVIENADRIAQKPNLLSSGGEIVLIDHEQGLPLLMDESGRELRLWQEIGYLAKHVYSSRFCRMMAVHRLL
jgi:hypothetical protein